MSHGDSKNTLLLRMATLIYGGASLTPQLPTIAGLKLHLKADAITGLADGAAVATWEDQSGEGNDATQGTAGERPTYQTNELNGKPVVRFDASDDGMLTSLTLVGPYTIILVERGRAGAGLRTISSATANALISATRVDGLNAYINAVISNYSVAVDTPVILGLVIPAAANGFYFVNGVDRTSGTHHENWGQVAIGSEGGEYANTDLAEVIAYDSALSTADREAVEAYLAAKYAITIP